MPPLTPPEELTAPAVAADQPRPTARASSGRVDVLVAGAGTGGTITGLSRAIKKAHNPQCVVVGVDPVRPSRPYPKPNN